MIDRVKKKIDEISNEIVNITGQNYSLLEGNSGLLLFLYKYSELNNNKQNTAFFEKQLRKFIRNFQEVNTSTFCDGFFGNIWLMDYFEKENVLDDLLIDIKEDINKIYLSSADLFLASKSYDFLHGALGLIYVGASCKHISDSSIKYLADAMLLDMKIEGDTAYFSDWMYKQKNVLNEGKINFSLSHGLSSVASVFSSYRLSSGDYSGYSERFLNFIYKYKTFKVDKNHYSSTVVSERKFEDDSKRLAWCYGDVGIACTFYKVGKKLNIESYKKEGIAIMLNLSSRRNLTEGALADACLCHGTAGIAHIFNRFYKETNIKEFDDARWFWLEETLKMANFKDGYAGYKTFRGSNEWVIDYGILEGISGIGLVLLGFLSDDIKDLNWDECLLIS